MILTGDEIRKRVKAGRITLDPLDGVKFGPNSVDLTLHPELRVYSQDVLDCREDNPTLSGELTEEGGLLLPGRLYLARTVETVGSSEVVPVVSGRSSLGRLGICIHCTAGFCDLGFVGTITLEVTVTHPVVVYPGMRVCQVWFLEPVGDREQLYGGKYNGQVDATASRLHLDDEAQR